MTHRPRRYLLAPVAMCLAALPLTASAVSAAPMTGSTAPTTGSTAAAPATAMQPRGGRPAVIGARIIGRSVHDRPLYAFHLGDPEAALTVVGIGSVHGDEQQSATPLRNLRDHRPISGVDLWVLPVMNPDGYARNDRQNAHGVDLNRNFPVHWTDLDGEQESGPYPASEPETQAMMAFLKRIDPDHVVSLHQPLRGIDPRTKNPAFARQLARDMYLPLRHIDCGGACHGTMTQWFNKRRAGDAITAELAASPSRRYLNKVGPNGLLRAVGGHR